MDFADLGLRRLEPHLYALIGETVGIFQEMVNIRVDVLWGNFEVMGPGPAIEAAAMVLKQLRCVDRVPVCEKAPGAVHWRFRVKD